MSKKGYRQKPWLYIVTDPVKGWRNKIARPTEFNLNLALDEPSFLRVTLPEGSHIAPIRDALLAQEKLSFVFVVPAEASFRFDGLVTALNAGPGERSPPHEAVIIIDMRTYRARKSRAQPKAAA